MVGSRFFWWWVKTYRVRYSTLKVKYCIWNFTQWCIYPLYNTKKIWGWPRMGKHFIGLKSCSHQGRVSGFQCSQYKNTPSEVVRSKQEKLHNIGPRRPQGLIFSAKWPYLLLEIWLSLKNYAYSCVERYFRPLPKSALKSDHFGHLDPKPRTFQYSPRFPSNNFFNQKLSFTHRGSYKVKKSYTYHSLSSYSRFRDFFVDS